MTRNYEQRNYNDYNYNYNLAEMITIKRPTQIRQYLRGKV